MPNPIVGLIGAGIGSSVIASKAQSKSASQASDAQTQAAQLSIDEQRRQFDAVQKLLAPFIDVGNQAIGPMAALAGANGAGVEQAAIDQVMAGPGYQTAVQQGEEALLANASATGGLRGGNAQASLAELRPQILSQAIAQRYGQLGGLVGIGQASATGQAAAAQNLGQGISDAYGQQGAAQAGAYLAKGQATQNMIGGINQSFGQLASFAGAPPAGAGMFARWGF